MATKTGLESTPVFTLSALQVQRLQLKGGATLASRSSTP
jgi:hypothetical protein